MALGNAVNGFAFGVLNELIGLMRSDEGIARPSRYEVILIPPAGGRSSSGISQNPFATQLQQMVRGTYHSNVRVYLFQAET